MPRTSITVRSDDCDGRSGARWIADIGIWSWRVAKKLILAVGETWFVKLPLHPLYPPGVIKAEIEEMRGTMLVLRRRPDLDDGIFGQLLGRFDREDVKFLERVFDKDLQ